jgi:hypothetical protein
MALEGTPVVKPPVTGENCDDQNIIAPPRQFNRDGCEVLPKLKIHEVSRGQDARLIWQFVNQAGEPVSLINCVGSCDSADSEDATPGKKWDSVGDPPCGAVLRIREATGYGGLACDPIYQVEVEIVDAVSGCVRSRELPEEIIRCPGIYAEEWAIVTEDQRVLFTNPVYLWVNRGLFGMNATPGQDNSGPPTIDEIRLSIRDNSADDNLLLDDIEFDSSEFAQAAIRPVQWWHETPPPLRDRLTSITFPFREMWMKGIQSELFLTAAHHYRRNKLNYNAGGIAVGDMDKEKEYAQAATALRQEFQDMVIRKKVEINTAMFTGSVGSIYGGLFR